MCHLSPLLSNIAASNRAVVHEYSHGMQCTGGEAGEPAPQWAGWSVPADPVTRRAATRLFHFLLPARARQLRPRMTVMSARGEIQQRRQQRRTAREKKEVRDRMEFFCRLIRLRAQLGNTFYRRLTRPELVCRFANVAAAADPTAVEQGVAEANDG